MGTLRRSDPSCSRDTTFGIRTQSPASPSSSHGRPPTTKSWPSLMEGSGLPSFSPPTVRPGAPPSAGPAPPAAYRRSVPAPPDELHSVLESPFGNAPDVGHAPMSPPSSCRAVAPVNLHQCSIARCRLHERFTTSKPHPPHPTRRSLTHRDAHLTSQYPTLQSSDTDSTAPA